MKCLNCGKEIPEGRKFCSSSCSAKYNNVQRKAKPWTEEQKKDYSIRKRLRNDLKRVEEGKKRYYTDGGELAERSCIYCGRPSRKHKVCDECKEYHKIPLYKKLKIDLHQPLKCCFEEAYQILKKLYFEDKLSAPEIWKKTGVNFRTLRDILAAKGVKTRTLSEGGRLAFAEGRSVLSDTCSYEHGYHTTWEGLEIFYRSSYELEYAQKLDKQQIPYRVESLRIRYFDTQKGIERTAIPDFYLPETNEIIEIKSSWTYKEQEMKDKFRAYRKAGYSPKLILEKKEVDIE